MYMTVGSSLVPGLLPLFVLQFAFTQSPLFSKYVDSNTFSFNSKNECMDRGQLDRRRLEEAHMRFCILDVFKRYPQTFPTWTITSNLQQTLDDITPLYYSAFATRYAG